MMAQNYWEEVLQNVDKSQENQMLNIFLRIRLKVSGLIPK